MVSNPIQQNLHQCCIIVKDYGLDSCPWSPGFKETQGGLWRAATHNSDYRFMSKSEDSEFQMD